MLPCVTVVVGAGCVLIVITGVTAAPACVTVTDLLVTPGPETVTVPTRCAEPVFAAAVSVRLPFPLPLPGDTVSQDAASLTAVQETLEVTVTLVEPPAAAGLQVAADNARAGPGVSPTEISLSSTVISGAPSESPPVRLRYVYWPSVVTRVIALGRPIADSSAVSMHRIEPATRSFTLFPARNAKRSVIRE